MVEETDRLLSVGQGEFTLDRYPRLAREMLRAWDAADEYVLNHLTELGVAGGSGLVVNDGFGALTVALAGASSAPWAVQMQSDSWLAHAGTRANLEANEIDVDGVAMLDPLAEPAPFDALLFKVPRSLALLEDQLQRLRPHLRPDTVIVGAGMVKQIHTSTLQLCERFIGPTRTSLARRKARLIHCTLDATLDVPTNPKPTQYRLDDTKLELSNHAALFSREQLDVGTRFLLEHLPRSPQARCIVDLGCGNGVLGIVAGRHHRQAALVFTDESAM
ncbi:MAG: methyltransferase, partial [Gemmatimonadetes bacterium]|nr:methyltransferase [Gemmatimonadota bacterium]